MENNLQIEERWRRIRAAFFRAPAPPSPRETEDFVLRVMDRLAAEEAPLLAPLLDWLGARWMIPALSLGFAALLFSIAVPRVDSIAPPDLGLLIGGSERTLGQLVLPPDPATSDSLSAVLSSPQ